MKKILTESDALIDAENACWVCESAIDESKPVNLPERIEHDRIEDKKKKWLNK